MAPVLIRSNSAWSFTARSLNSSRSMILPSPGNFWLLGFSAGSASVATPHTRLLTHPLHRLDRKPVQRLHGELQVLLRRVLVFGVAEAAKALDEDHYGRHEAGHLRRVVQGPAGQSVRPSGYLVARLFRERDEVFVEGDGLYAPQPLPLDGDVFFGGDAGGGLLGGVEHARQHGGVEGALVEGHLAPPVERGDDGGADVDEARGGPHIVASPGVVAEGYRRTGCRDERVPPYFHRGGTGMGVLARKTDGVTLDAEGA